MLRIVVLTFGGDVSSGQRRRDRKLYAGSPRKRIRASDLLLTSGPRCRPTNGTRFSPPSPAVSNFTIPSFKPRKPATDTIPPTTPRRWPVESLCTSSISSSLPHIFNGSPSAANWPHNRSRQIANHFRTASTRRTSTTRLRCPSPSPRSRKSARAPPPCSRRPTLSAPDAATTTMTTCSARRTTRAAASSSV